MVRRGAIDRGTSRSVSDRGKNRGAVNPFTGRVAINRGTCRDVIDRGTSRRASDSGTSRRAIDSGTDHGTLTLTHCANHVTPHQSLGAMRFNVFHFIGGGGGDLGESKIKNDKRKREDAI